MKNLKRALFKRRISLPYTIPLFLCCLYISSTAEVVGYKKELWPWQWNVRDDRHQVTDFPETYNEHSVGCHPTMIHFKTGINNINVIVLWRLKLKSFSLTWLILLQVGLVLKALFFVLMVACNVRVWTCFVKALQHSTSSLTPTVTSTAVNYISSVCYFKWQAVVTTLNCHLIWFITTWWILQKLLQLVKLASPTSMCWGD